MTTRILANPNTAEGKVLLDCADLVHQAQAAIVKLNGEIGRMNTGPDNAAVQTEFGLGTLQNAADLIFLVNSAATAMQASIITEFVERTSQD